jgi:ABC-type nitrate/sulfonate/bicarbonate transport system substrate-binding protein
MSWGPGVRPGEGCEKRTFMKKTDRPTFITKICLCLCLSVSFLAWPLAQAQPAQQTLALAMLPHAAPVLIADVEGYFAAEGLNLKVIDCVNGRRCLKHLTDGQAQYATVADTPIALLGFSAKDFAVVATTTTSARENKLMVHGESGIRSPANLVGKRLGIVKGTTSQYFADVFLRFYGIDPRDVTLVALDPTDPVGPLQRRDVDAASLYQPHGQRAKEALGPLALILPSPKVFTVTFNLVSVPGASDEEIKRLLRAVQRAQRLIASEPAKARAIVAARLKQDPKVVDAIWADFDFALGLHQPLINTLEAQARWAQREGQVLPAALPDFLDLMRPEPLRSLDRRAVTLVK